MSTDLSQIERLIRIGKFSNARFQLLQIKPRLLPREELSIYANLTRRVGLLARSAKALRPIIHQNSRTAIAPPAANEKAEYAATLIQLGALDEADRLLKEAQNQAPESRLYRAIGHFRRWEHHLGIPFLLELLDMKILGPYQETVAKINLASAYLVCQQEVTARQLLLPLAEAKQPQDQSLIMSNIHELLGKACFALGDLVEAQKYFSSGAEFLTESSTRHSLWLKKWQTFLKAKQFPGTQWNQDFAILRGMALELSDWDTLRDCDLYEGTSSENFELLTKVYFGTPFESYRKNILRLNPSLKEKLPVQYIWGTDASSQKNLIDLLDPKLFNSKGAARIGSNIHRLLLHMSGDFYRPFPLGSIALAIAPTPYYNHEIASNRLHNLLFRTRAWITKNNLGLTVTEKKHSYALSPILNTGVLIRWQGRGHVDSLESVEWERLRNTIKTESFSIQDAMKILGCKSTKALKILNWAVMKNLILIYGKGKNTQYHFISAESAQRQTAA